MLVAVVTKHGVLLIKLKWYHACTNCFFFIISTLSQPTWSAKPADPEQELVNRTAQGSRLALCLQSCPWQISTLWTVLYAPRPRTPSEHYKWKCGQDQQTKTLTVVHSLVPERKLFTYCEKLQRTFLSWLPPYYKNLCSKLLLQDILDCELDRGAVYFIHTVDFTGPNPSDVDYTERSSTEPTFALQIQSYNGTMPIRPLNSTGDGFQGTSMWETTCTPHMDDSTRHEMVLPPRRGSSATVTAAVQRPEPGSYRADGLSMLQAAIEVDGPSVLQEVIDVDGPSVSQEVINVDAPSVLQAAIDASFNEPQPKPSAMPPVSIRRPTDLYKCPCCYEWTHMCVFNCGHVACENCIL